MEQERVERLLAQWEETYKKGLLSFWLLLLLSQRKAYPYEMKEAITELSQNTISADENSIYRSLNRLSQSGVVDSKMQPSETGPDRRYFYLTDLGRELLKRFIARNIQVFQHPQVADLIQQSLALEK
jgi:PadR family transcriptional regulator PadR